MTGPVSRVKLGRLLVVVAGAAAGVLSLVIAGRAPGNSLVADSPAAAVVELIAGWGLVVVGVGRWHRRGGSGCARLLALAGFLWLVREWNSPGAPSAAVFTGGLVFYAGCAPVVAHALLLYCGVRVARLERAVIGVGYAGAVLFLGLLPALFFDPAGQGCSQCSTNLVLLHAGPDVASWLGRLGAWISCAAVLGLAALVLRQWVGSTVAHRRAIAPVAVPGIAYLALAVWEYQHAWDRGFLGSDSLDRRLWFGQALLLIAIVLGLLWEPLRARRTRAALARLVVDVARAPAPGGVRDMLAGALDDSSLAVFFHLPDGSRVDGSGRPARPDREQVVTELVRDNRRVAFLAHRPGLLDDASLVDGIAGAAWVALEHERLLAQLRAQLDELRVSRARIVEAGDAQRRRLERDLHDGAQQRLASLAIAIRLVRMQAGPDGDPASIDALDAAEAEVRAALADLREIAHGLYPSELLDEGLASGLEVLAEACPFPVTLSSLPGERLPPSVESAAYYLIAQALKRCRCGGARIRAVPAQGRLLIDIETDGGPPDEVIDLEDRIGALDGRLAIERLEPVGTRIHAELPCGS